MGAKDKLRAAAVAGLLLAGDPSAKAQNWTLTSAPTTNWTSISMSADGCNLVATVGRGLIYRSTNFGATWFPTPADERNWTAIASSADGTKLAAAAVHFLFTGGIWISTNSGFDWSWTYAYTNWDAIASSADGPMIAAADSGFYRYPGRIIVSTNGGQNWKYPFSVNAPEQLNSVAVSSDGIRCMVSSTSWIYASEDAGQSWAKTSATAGMYSGHEWTGIACSSDGWRWTATSLSGEIYWSSDFGTNWALASSPNLPWQAVASSSDGSRLLAIATNGPIHISTNSGISWFSTPSPSLQWQAVASSADGCKLVAVVYGGGIYTWQTTPSPNLNIAPTASGWLISWIVPSKHFVLQETAELSTPDWIDVANSPTLNYTNLHHEVTVPLSPTNRFYRLKLSETASQ